MMTSSPMCYIKSWREPARGQRFLLIYQIFYQNSGCLAHVMGVAYLREHGVSVIDLAHHRLQTKYPGSAHSQRADLVVRRLGPSLSVEASFGLREIKRDRVTCLEASTLFGPHPVPLRIGHILHRQTFHLAV